MNRSLVLEAHGDSAQGARPANEDAFTLLDERHPIVRERRRGSLFAVADGLGGHRGGAEAARIAVETLARFFDTVREPNGGGALAALRAVAEEAHRCVRERAGEDPALEGMGSTLTAALFRSDRMCFVHIGDSRLYVSRGGSLRLLTDDHTVAFQLRSAGRLSETEYRRSPYRHSLTSYLGADDADFQEGEMDLLPGDRFLLATDGLLKARREASLALTCRRAPSAREWVEGLLSRQARAAARDNATAVAVFVREGSRGRV
jgi:serine/threonine protein phosphatase PrpC